jgi:hypothetical protein
VRNARIGVVDNGGLARLSTGGALAEPARESPSSKYRCDVAGRVCCITDGVVLRRSNWYVHSMTERFVRLDRRRSEPRHQVRRERNVEARSKTIEQWFSMIEQAQVLLPRFQRHEAWRPQQINGLLENILRRPSLPIGALLVLEVGDAELFYSRPIVGAPQRQGRPQMHLLDGQQRVTALWRALRGDYNDLSLFVPLKSKPIADATGEQADDAPEVLAEKRWTKTSNNQSTRMPLWADDDSAIFARGLLPIECLCPGQKGEERLKKYMSVAATGGDIQEILAISARLAELRQRVAGYMVPFLSLPVGTGKETALDVFIKMNTSASPLTDYDIVVAQLEEALGQSLHEMVAELKREIPALERYNDVEDNVLAVAALLNGQPALKKSYLDENFGKRLGAVWPRLRKGFERGLEFLRLEGFLGEKLLPTEVAVYLICALWADVPEHGYDQEGNARTLIRKALWRACLTDRYGKTATTRAYADYKTLAAIIAGQPTGSPPELFNEADNPLPEQDQLMVAGWPTRKDRLPRALLAISLRQGGCDFADGAPASAENIRKREYHHVFPIASFPDGTPDSQIYRALNCALITWRTNRKLSATSPTDYIRQRVENASLGEAEIKARLASHRVPFQEIKTGDYRSFLVERAKLMREAIMALCNGAEPPAAAVKIDN